MVEKILENFFGQKMSNKLENKIFIIIFLIFFMFLCPLHSLAHQPRIVNSNKTLVTEPEISKAYYGVLAKQSHLFSINSTKRFELYVNVLVPFKEGPRKDILVEIYQDAQVLKTLNPKEDDWKEFYEPFGQSKYWQGPEFRGRVEAGKYKVLVKSKEKPIRYVLAIGETEAFDGKEGIKAILLIPDLKRHFFNESPASFILSPLGWGYILLMYIFSFVVGFVCRSTFKTFALGSRQSIQKNIGVLDRIIRFALWLGLLLWAIMTSWDPILLFLSGFALYEALFCWCGLYAALGSNTYRINQ